MWIRAKRQMENGKRIAIIVIPAQAGIQPGSRLALRLAGMTEGYISVWRAGAAEDETSLSSSG